MATSSDPANAELKLPFRPRARLLQLLGDQLIGTPRLAVFELVKNAYDADAEIVMVTLKDIQQPTGTIIVEDDGDGMTLETIRDIWLVPGHDHRHTQRKTLQRTRLHRLPLGEKGLGRFAVHKLGDQIELITRAKDHPECVAIIDWEALIKEPFLSDADVTVRTRTPQVFTGDNDRNQNDDQQAARDELDPRRRQKTLSPDNIDLFAVHGPIGSLRNDPRRARPSRIQGGLSGCCTGMQH